MRGKLPLDIDFEEKEIRIENNRRLYEFIETGAAIRLLPILAIARPIAEAMNVGCEWLVRVFEAFLYYYVGQYDLIYGVTASLSPAADADRSVL